MRRFIAAAMAGANPAVPPMQEAERSLSTLLQGYLQDSPEALVFFDREGTLLYQSTQGERQFKRWNRALLHAQAEARLPAALQPAFQRDGGPLRLQHPELTGLAVTLDAIPGGYVLRLMDDARVSEPSAQALASLKKLSSSEQRVARLAVEGLRNDQIAERLCRSPRTIEFHLHCAFRKLGVNNRVQLSRLLG